MQGELTTRILNDVLIITCNRMSLTFANWLVNTIPRTVKAVIAFTGGCTEYSCINHWHFSSRSMALLFLIMNFVLLIRIRG